MTTEKFNLAEFEIALFSYGLDFNFVPLGLVDGEYCYLLPITENAAVFLRSSIGWEKVARDTGEDSLRILPCEYQTYIDNYGGKHWIYNIHRNPEIRWVTRVSGWENRLQSAITKLAETIKKAGNCVKCGKPLRIMKVKKEGKNKGRWFATCEREHNQFAWLD